MSDYEKQFDRDIDGVSMGIEHGAINQDVFDEKVVIVDEVAELLCGLPKGQRTETKTWRFSDWDFKLESGALALKLREIVVVIARSRDHSGKMVCFRTISYLHCQQGWASQNRTHDYAPLLSLDMMNSAGGVLDRWDIIKTTTGCPVGCWSKFYRSEFSPDIFDATTTCRLLRSGGRFWKC